MCHTCIRNELGCTFDFSVYDDLSVVAVVPAAVRRRRAVILARAIGAEMPVVVDDIPSL
jgi:hypothetical protein